MDIRPIHTEEDYGQALERVAVLMDAKKGTPEGDELDILATLIERYEEEHHRIEAPDPVSAIQFRMEQMGLAAKDLEPIIGPSGRISEVLNRRRRLTLGMIRRLTKELRIPAEVLVREYELTDSAA